MKDSDSFDQAVPGAVYRTLLQFALLGTEFGDVASAQQIAEVLRDLRPDLPQARIVLATNDFYAGQTDNGILELESTLDAFPDCQLAKAMLAVCLQIAGRSGWQQLLEAVIEDGRDETAIGLACAILGRTHELAESIDEQRVDTAPANAMWA